MRFWTFWGPKAQSKPLIMAKAQHEAYVKKVKEMAQAHQVPAFTVPWELGCPTPYSEYCRIRDLPLNERKKRRTQLEAALKDPFPYRNYPHFHTTGLGWCQLWFLEDSVELNYCIFGMHIGLDVRVKSLRPDGKIEVWARSEEYDHTVKCMKLMAEDEGYSLKMTTSKVRTIIKVNRKN